MAAALVLGTSPERGGGSSPSVRTLSMKLTKNDWKVQYAPNTFIRTEVVNLDDDEVTLLRLVMLELAKAGVSQGFSLNDIDAETALKLIKLQQDGCPAYTIHGDNSLVKLTPVGLQLADTLMPFRVTNVKCEYQAGVDYSQDENTGKLVVMFRLLQPGYNGFLDLSMKISDVSSPQEREEFVAAARAAIIPAGQPAIREQVGTVYMQAEPVIKYLSRHVFPQMLKLGIKFNR